ncbi:hypothetical protein LCGC14_0698460 [marine sediment metagenome]|uniref:Uncharacterized protein n=1 Tax=marine sediment metagenome TaxID=412755 RepID=A0A0F9R3V6_9ZZZZ
MYDGAEGISVALALRLSRAVLQVFSLGQRSDGEWMYRTMVFHDRGTHIEEHECWVPAVTNN